MKDLDKYILDDGPLAKTAAELYPDAMAELLTPFPSVALDTFPSFNRLIGGLRPREFSILCGATGVGKTTFVANVSASLLVSKVPHFVASVETGATDFVKRVISVLDDRDLNTGDPTPINDAIALNAKYGGLVASSDLHLSLYDNRFSVAQLMSDIANMVKTHGIKLAIIDNLNFFLEVTSATQSVVEMDRVIHELIIFCKRVDVHVLMIMHPKKTESGRVESEMDVKGSSTAVQEAHNIFLLNRPSEKSLANGMALKQDRELKIAKMRRRGRASGMSIILKSASGVKYTEGTLYA